MLLDEVLDQYPFANEEVAYVDKGAVAVHADITFGPFDKENSRSACPQDRLPDQPHTFK